MGRGVCVCVGGGGGGGGDCGTKHVKIVCTDANGRHVEGWGTEDTMM